MSEISTEHGTVVIERTIAAPIARVFAALADVRQRAEWAVPSDTAVIFYDEADFRVGGRDVARCGAKGDPRFRVETRYVDIIAERRVVQTETIHDGDKLLSVHITTLELVPEGQATRVTSTVQLTSFVGPDMLDYTKLGHEGSLENLARFLAQAIEAR